jgi:hypothetical protein
MKKLCMLALLAAALPAHAEKIDRAIYGRWKITSVADFAGVVAETDLASSRRMIGTNLFITPQAVKFAGEECRKPSFNVERKTLAQAFRVGFQMETTDKLKLPDPVAEVELECDNETETDFSLFYVKDKRHIVFVWSGVLFNAALQR